MSSAPLPLISAYLIATTIFCHLIDLKYRIPADYINFSGQSLKTHKYHVLILSSFFHGNTSHLFKEITLLLPLAIIIEIEFGAIYLLLSYFTFGIIGCVLTWLTDRHYYSQLFPDGKFLADYIWSRGASGNVYGLIAFTSIIFGDKYLFEHIQTKVSNYGLIWCLITNFIFHIFSHKSHFKHNPTKAYPILIIITLFVIYILPQKMTINCYLIIYFIHMSVLRRNPSIFNKTNRANFIASDYKCHLFASVFGLIVGSIIVSKTYDNGMYSLQFLYNVLPTLTLFVSDGYYGQYMVQQRIKRRIEERKEQERLKQQQEKEDSIE
eukprot:143104_1